MENNEVDTENLMSLTDSRKFLKQSKYKPTKYNNVKVTYNTALVWLIGFLIIFVILMLYYKSKK